jgi:uncharacterized protein (DUF2062 family)
MLCLEKTFIMIKKTIKSFLQSLVTKERSAHKLALAFSVGVYIAFSPFPGFHTALVFALSWLLQLNIPVVWTVSVLINNPWTMIPVYAAGHIAGQWLCLFMCGHDLLLYNPAWMNWFNSWVCCYTNLCGISLWSFLIGGNILGIGFGLISYPIMLYIFKGLMQEQTLASKQ